MIKSADAFRTISEVAEWLDTETHVLRFWESKFSQIKPVKRAGGRRYYRPKDMLIIGGIKKLLHEEGIKYAFSTSSEIIKKRSDLLSLGRAPMLNFDNKDYVCGSAYGAFHYWDKILQR